MTDVKVTQPVGSEDAEVFVSASEDEAGPQVITPELLSALVKQVEFYFSDANLPTDKKLLKQIRKDPEGYVPVKLFANFRKVRALSKDVGIITEALRSASLLQLSQDGKRVRRLVPVPEYDISDIQRRTIVVENLPGTPSPTIERVTDMFRVYGRVKLVRICSRESKGKLPSWLTSSCQHMGGTQHAYVEFEEEEGAILASAALALDSDAPDGVVQVRRLLACIAEQRERRSVTGAGSSSFGGSSGGGSRKGSRDVSPMGSRNANSRRGSGGGGWTSSSAGGAASDSYHPPFHTYRTYGGAFDHGGASRSGSGGGAGPSPPLSFVPPPPPPPRRSCDSAPASDLLPAATTFAAPLPTPTASSSGRSDRSHVYRPPAKRLSDSYQCGFQPSSTGGAPSGVVGGVPPPLQRCAGGSFGSSCGTGTPVSASTTPTAVSSASTMSNNFITLVANSPPLATRGASSGGGRPPVHPAIVPPPPPPPPKPQHSSVDSQAIAVVTPPIQHPAQVMAGALAAPPVAPSTALASSALADAIAQLQAERRASDAGATKLPNADGPQASASVPVAPSSVPLAVAARNASTAPKFCLDLAAAPQSRGQRAKTSQDLCADAAVKTVQPNLPRGSKTQMVANVEDFINNILAGRPAPRPTPAQTQLGSAPTCSANNSSQTRKPSSPTVCVSQRTPTAPQQVPAVEAALAVAGILASTLRRPNVACPPASPPITAVSSATSAKPSAASSNEHVSSVAAAEASVPRFAPTVYLTAVAPGEADHGIGADFSLEHAVTVTVHRSPGAGDVGTELLDGIGKKSVVPLPAPDITAAFGPMATYASSGGINSSVNSPPSSPAKGGIKGIGGKGSSAAVTTTCNGQTTALALSARGNGGQQPGPKRLTRRDYAQWAAATPEFRAEAVSKYTGPSASGSPNSTAGGLGRSSGGGAAAAGPAGTCGSTSPSAMGALSISDGGVFGTAVSSGHSSGGVGGGGGGGGHFHLSVPAPMWHVARGPDGSKGFAGRTRVPAA